VAQFLELLLDLASVISPSDKRMSRFGKIGWSVAGFIALPIILVFAVAFFVT